MISHQPKKQIKGKQNAKEKINILFSVTSHAEAINWNCSLLRFQFLVFCLQFTFSLSRRIGFASI